MSEYLNELQKQALLLSASGLGVCFAILYRITRQIVKATYEERGNFFVIVNVVLGLISGMILAQFLPVNNVGDLGTLTTPTLALLGGFSATAVFRIMTKIVEAIENLFSSDAEERVEVAKERADANVRSTQAALANELLRARGDPNVVARIDELIDRLAGGDGAV